MAILAGASTRILVQGITGREAATFTLESLRYGAQVVAGVTPGKGGQQVHGVPVFDTVASALAAHACDAALISVPAPMVLDAASEAMANGLKLIVVVTERLARADGLALLERARAAGARLVGPNSLGIITPGQTRVGMAGGDAASVRRAYQPGSIGVVSRSGGMMTEIANLLTQSGFGQSTCVSIGGDQFIGTRFEDLLPLYEADPATEGLALFCEPGGSMEERLAERLTRQPSRLPIVAFVAGRFADRNPGVRFGHAGALVQGSSGSPARKIEALRAAGVLVADKLQQMPELLRAALPAAAARPEA